MNISPLVCLNTKFIWSKKEIEVRHTLFFSVKELRRTHFPTWSNITLHIVAPFQSSPLNPRLLLFHAQLCNEIAHTMQVLNYSNFSLKPQLIQSPTLQTYLCPWSTKMAFFKANNAVFLARYQFYWAKSFLWYHHDERKLLVLKLPYKNLSLWHFDTLKTWDLSPQDLKTLRPWALKDS